MNIFSKIQLLLQFRVFLVFFSGFFFGFIFSFLLYIFLFIKKINKDQNNNLIPKNNLKSQEMMNLIKDTQNNFVKDIEKKNDEYIFFLLKNSKELILKISSSFYPKSNFPYLEFTIEESLSLIQYIHKRIDELFQKKIIFMFRKITLRRIFLLRQRMINKKNIDKLKKTNKLWNMFSNVINVINPFYWLKKVFLNNLYNVLINHIGCAIISILGEEVYKIYSKTLFQSEKNIIDNFLEDLQKELDKKE
ncbi:hypothetical protein AXA84_0279 [Candidatus Phytoplasma oryzae]|uniref:Uncharacterized protein n=1 Tax=Candidatus Phytoplasma oryzae TaxID=203274 RepID=A0A139JQD6_9MOLU|nr:hypothetical protein [Candidatus Phytoplasma oryzae]KXT29191.1 hypothetical protein AXA84_0293 [Candidatus Phytoplasma oryzae]KXT29207.1 hypothetical protein AXA84_0279 [Candidatus Phytoplasma oryzae]RAM57734.1 hypothetical protein DH96_01355 [Candidatus Phytoplasma oryzae]